MTARDMANLLLRKGFVKVRQKGSHAMFKNIQMKRQVTIPMHSKDLPKGLEAAIRKQAGI